MTEEEQKAAARIAYEEAGYWYAMLKQYAYDKPVIPKMQARLVFLAKMAGIEHPDM